MRLIDADSLFESIRDYTFDTTSIEMRRAEHLVKSHICELIEKQPTAYDVDKVVERLGELDLEGVEMLEDGNYHTIQTEEIIEIVRAGIKEKRECEECFYYDRPSDAPETVDKDCMYIPEKNNDGYTDYTLPCKRK